MARKRSPTGAGRPQKGDGPGRRVVSFVVELVLDETGAVHRTSVLRVEDGEQDAWSEWRPERLVAFVEERAGLHAARAEPLPQAATDPSADWLSRLALSVATPFVRAGEPFEVRLRLQGAEVAPTDYVVALQAKNLEDAQRHPLGEARGRWKSGNPTDVVLGGIVLPAGIHRLAARVLLIQGSAPPFEVELTGGLVQAC